MKREPLKMVKVTLIISLTILLLVLMAVLIIKYPRQETDCKDYPLSECPERCMVCPPCEVCSSLACQSEKFCQDMGFNRSWQESIGY